jgi:capsid protein
MVAFYEAHSLANPESPSAEWVDGVKVNPRDGTHTHYGFLGIDGKVKVIPASAVIYYGEFESPGHTRAVPPLAHAVNHAIDITEIRADTKHNIKTAALFGVAREVEKGAPATKSQRGIGGALNELRTLNSAGNETRFESREVYGGAQIPELPPGHKLSVIHDDRPSPNQTAFMDELIRDIATGYGLPPEVIWKMGSLNGPGVRFVMDYAARWIEKEQARLWDWAERVWWYFLSFETRQGLGFPSSGDFLAIEWIPQRDLTIDRGREGKQRLDEISRGVGTMSDWHKSMSGASGERKIMERIDEVKFGMEYAESQGVPYDRAFPAPAGSTQAPPEEAPEEEPTPASS